MRRLFARAGVRAILIFFFLIFAVAIPLAAPWAWLTSRGSLGYTTFEEWKNDLRLFSVSELRAAARYWWTLE